MTAVNHVISLIFVKDQADYEVNKLIVGRSKNHIPAAMQDLFTCI